ncbi:hypothetical protein [Thermococcus sp.]|uniref:hypothetical protein n=1 Tax=Thermococcus sp. TaxID=35749 RepID=UPI0026008CAC|nr:hypothetical protein [Thermococcus sp.]
MVKVDVEPADYYPIIDKLFTEEIVGALDALGVSVGRIGAKVEPDGDNMGIDFSLVVSSEGNRQVSSMEAVIRIAIERIIEEANGRFTGMGNGRFVLKGLKLIEVSETGKSPFSPPNIDIKAASDELRKSLEKIAKGLWIKLQERDVKVVSILVNFEEGPKPRVLVSLNLNENLTFYERKLLAEYVSDKMEGYLWTTVGKGEYTINVILSTPSDREKEKENPNDGIDDDDVRELLRNLTG